MRALASKAKRFNQLEQSLQGISSKTLSERLCTLAEEDSIVQQFFATVPPGVE